ncbi:hypothetical protein [Candidatus Electronema sp. JC]|uniref:hypothetical protein n=1 Tax=Candidatus Electronema sp. JC TaxID=3401570 RepID=UPI003AA853B6
MKKLQNINDRLTMCLIEAVRVSYLIAESNYNNLLELLRIFNNSHTDSVVLIYSSAWTLIDMLHRYGDCIGKIRGLSHKDERYSNFDTCLKEVNSFRNYIQHLSGSKTSKKLARNDVYPVMGALSYSLDGLTSKTISYATLPIGTSFNTLAYSSNEEKYEIDIKIGCLDMELSLMKLMEKLKGCHSYLNEFLLSKKYISTEDLMVNYLESGPISKQVISDEGIDVSDGYRDILDAHSKNELLRLKMTIN